jgi:ribonuclease HII
MIIGIDEVGTGPLAGPVVVAAVLIEKGLITGVRDSKLVAENQRYPLADEIKRRATWYQIAERSSADINNRGLAKCLRECMRELAEAAKAAYPNAEVIIDGKKDHTLLQIPQLSFLKFQIGGDRLVYQISAASLIAKVHRDRQMIEFARHYPDYGFERHKGYPTPQHLAALRKYGATRIHRKKVTDKSLSQKVFARPKVAPSASETSPLSAADEYTLEVFRNAPEGRGADCNDDYPIEMAQKYINQASGMFDVLSDWSRGFVKSIRKQLNGKGALTPRQKFFLKRLVLRAREDKSKKEKARLKHS